MNLVLLCLTLALALTTSRADEEGSLVKNTGIWDESRWTALVDETNHMLPNVTLVYLHNLAKSESIDPVRATFARKLESLSSYVPLNCSKENEVNLSEFDQEWSGAYNIFRYRKYYKELHEDDCKWWSMSVTEKFKERPPTDYTCASLIRGAKLSSGLRSSFLALRAFDRVRETCPAEYKHQIEQVADLIQMTICSGPSCCSTGIDRVPTHKPLEEYKKQVKLRALTHCYRYINDKLRYIFGLKYDSSNVLEDYPKLESYQQELEKVSKTIERFLRRRTNFHPLDRARFGKTQIQLFEFQRSFLSPCNLSLKECTAPKSSPAMKVIYISQVGLEIRDIVNEARCRNLVNVFQKVCADINRKN